MVIQIMEQMTVRFFPNGSIPRQAFAEIDIPSPDALAILAHAVQAASQDVVAVLSPFGIVLTENIGNLNIEFVIAHWFIYLSSLGYIARNQIMVDLDKRTLKFLQSSIQVHQAINVLRR
jgi:hypothetical protein